MSYRLCFLIIILLQFCPLPAQGNEFRLLPSISLMGQYNSNILLSADEVKSDFIAVVSPGLELINRTERLDTELLLRFDRLEYADNRDLSATNQLYSGRFRYLVTPLLAVSSAASFVKDSNPTLDIGAPVNIPPGTIILPPEPGVPGPPGVPGVPPGEPASGTPFPVISVPRHTFNYSLSSDYQFSEKLQTNVSYQYQRDYYSNPRYDDDISHNVTVGLVYDLGKYFPAVKGRWNGGYSYYHFPDSWNNSVSQTIGFSRDFNEVWSILVDGGVRYTWSKVFITRFIPLPPDAFKAVRVRLDNNGWGGVARVSLNYRGEKLNGSLAYNRDLTLASGLNGAAERNAVTLSAQYRLMYELSCLLTAGYYTFASDNSNFSSSRVKQRTFLFQPGVRYELSKDVAVEASYAYAKVECPVSDAGARIECPVSNKGADRHIASLSLSVQHPFFE